MKEMDSVDGSNDKKKKKKGKSTWIAYLCWFIGGIFGLHLFYLRRDRHAFIHWMTLGGCLGCGMFRDLFLMRTYVAKANSDPKYVKTIRDKMKKYKKPPFSISNFSKQLSIGYIFGVLYWYSIPNEELGTEQYDLTWLRCLSPIAVALGIHTCGNIDHEQGSMRASLVSGFFALVLSYTLIEEVDGSQMLGFTSFVAATAFTLISKRWREIKTTTNDESKHEAGFFRRVLILSFCGFVVLALVSSGLYFNLKVELYGEKLKFRDAANIIFSKESYEQIKSAYRDFRNFYSAHGWEKVFDQVYDQMDYSQEDKARKVLGVTSNASKADIVSRWRTLSKEWHPDKHRDPKKKVEAQNKFMEFQAAYQTLVKIRGKFKASKGKDEF